jgi:amidohydrolase
VIGRGGHGAYPHLATDAIPIAAQLVTALQTVVARTIDPLASAVLTIGTIHGGFRSNVIAPEVEMTGTVRTFDAELRKSMPQRIEQIAHGIASAHGATHVLDYAMNYPPVINHAVGTDLIATVARELVGDARVRTIPPSMGGEDFAYYVEKVPGCFYWLGCAPREGAPNLHSPEFDIDESSLLTGMHVMASAAVRFLGG